MSGALWVEPDAGVIATLRHGEGERALHFKGRPTDALRDVIALCDRFGLKIVSLSSPTTIYRDLDGSREYATVKRSGQGHDVAYPEVAMLGHLKRLDLWVGAHG